MIELYRETDSPEADWVEAELKDMVVGYACQVVSPADLPPNMTGLGLPILRDGEKLASGRNALMDFLIDLRKFVEQWRMFQSDSCYIHDDGQNC